MGLDKSFKYTTAAESAKPGYLKAKFDKIWRQLREEAEAKAKQDKKGKKAQ